MKHEKAAREYRAIVSEMNREPPPDDEYSRTSACDALAEAYDLERYPTPRIPKRRPRADLAVGRGDGVFSFRGESEPPCRG